jgi:MFS family permease
LLLLKNPNVFFTSFQTGIAFGCYYFIIALLPSTFGPIYNFTPQQVGFTFVAGGIGSGLGSITAGKISDKYCAKVASKNYGRPAMEARLRLAFYVIPLVLIGMVMYGWFLHARVHWAVPLISLGICK